MHYTQPEVYEFISKQTNDPIVEWKTCRISGTKFPIYQSDTEFYDKISPTFDGKKYKIPTPTLCPEERQRRRLAFRNERVLYKRKCNATGKDIISIYHPEKEFPVYHPTVWWSDSWSAHDFGLDYDFTKTFTEQFKRLQSLVPMCGRTSEEPTMHNSDYCNEAGEVKNCYLCFEVGQSSDSYYCRGIMQCDKLIDCLNCYNCSDSYQLVESQNCTQCLWCTDCKNCLGCVGCAGCDGCSYCIESINLVNKKYCMHNKQVTEEEFKAYVKNNVKAASLSSRLKCTHNIWAEKSTGDYLVSCSNTQFSYSCADATDCRYCDGLLGGATNDKSYDVTNFGIGCLYCYEDECVGGNPGISKNVLFSSKCRPATNLLYCFYCVTSTNNCFGCIGLKGGEYSILNKKYTKNDYERKVGEIIKHMQKTGEWGEFFKPSLSTFGYNETMAQEYFPLINIGTKIIDPKEESLDYASHGYRRTNYEGPLPQVAKMLKVDEIGDIYSVSDDILSKTLQCEQSGRPYRIIKQELDFYRKHNIPLPRKHPDIRHEERMAQRPGRNLYLRKCDQCEEEMVSVYPANHTAKVYCDGCYKKIVYG